MGAYDIFAVFFAIRPTQTDFSGVLSFWKKSQSGVSIGVVPFLESSILYSYVRALTHPRLVTHRMKQIIR